MRADFVFDKFPIFFCQCQSSNFEAKQAKNKTEHTTDSGARITQFDGCQPQGLDLDFEPGQYLSKMVNICHSQHANAKA